MDWLAFVAGYSQINRMAKRREGLIQMSKRNRNETPDVVARRIKEGRGQGHGAEYRPWLTIRDVASRGLSTRSRGWKTGRVHHFLSQNEQDYFYLLEWSDIVTDIREQFPLNFEKTRTIAYVLGIKHPIDPKTREEKVVTTDFLVDIVVNNKKEIRARAIKPYSELNSKRVIEKLEIEQAYWRSEGIDWGVVTENEIPSILVNNIKWVHQTKEITDNGIGITVKNLNQIERVIFNKLNRLKYPLSVECLEVDNQLGLVDGASLWVVHHLVANKLWIVNMDDEELCKSNKPFKVLRRGVIRNMAGETS